MKLCFCQRRKPRETVEIDPFSSWPLIEMEEGEAVGQVCATGMPEVATGITVIGKDGRTARAWVSVTLDDGRVRFSIKTHHGDRDLCGFVLARWKDEGGAT